MGIPFLLALSISSRRANSLLHFLKCVLSRLVPPSAPVVICFMVNLHSVQVKIVFSSFCTKNLYTKDLLTHTMVFERVGKGGISFCSGNSIVGLVGVGISSFSSLISTSSSNSSSKLVKHIFINVSIIININSKSRWQMFRTRTTSSSSPIFFAFQHWSFTTISFRIHDQV
ncbi:hypothetical protein H5410_062159 [Solanum commersonii]|uniref:Uncharacterized protein n=1 Tax=Solanum commersonii TaxID=4109 RepID=A0A9J5W9X2_SOLCO|nr:hypothetical protein H5410_062159 [Solanum commersonii]